MDDLQCPRNAVVRFPGLDVAAVPLHWFRVRSTVLLTVPISSGQQRKPVIVCCIATGAIEYVKISTGE